MARRSACAACPGGPPSATGTNPSASPSGGYFSDPAIHAAFDNFWRNHPVPGTGKGVQDLYIEGVAALAARFRDETAVFGIDLMNEAFPGSHCNQAGSRRCALPRAGAVAAGAVLRTRW